MGWTVETLSTTVDKERNALPAVARARFVRIGQLVAAVGLDRVGAPHLWHLSGPLWESRLRGGEQDVAGPRRHYPG